MTAKPQPHHVKQDPNIKRFKTTLIYYDTDTQYANFRGNALRQATKRHLNNSETVKNDEKINEKETYPFFFWLICCRLFSATKQF